MDAVWATVISGIGAAVIAGLIGIISSAISYRVAHRQLESQLEENNRNRRHQILLAIVTKRQQAIEDIWQILFAMERHAALDDKDLDMYIRSLMWLPSDLRNSCLEFLGKHKAYLASHQGALFPLAEISALRQDLITVANSVELEHITARS